MARVEFRFIVSDIALTEADHERIGRAIAQAGALALAELTPIAAVTVPLGHNIWWRGIPAPELQKAIQQYALQEAGFQAQG
jgi:hypothetical protein